MLVVTLRADIDYGKKEHEGIGLRRDSQIVLRIIPAWNQRGRRCQISACR
jgi:hypothetical protein